MSKEPLTPRCRVYRSKEDFLAYCSKIWEAAIEKELFLINAIHNIRGLSITKKQPDVKKIKVDLFLTTDIFTKKDCVDDLDTFYLIPFVFVKNSIVDSKILEELKVKEVEVPA